MSVGTIRRRVNIHLFECAVAVAFTIVGIAYLSSPGVAERSPVGHAVHPFDEAWSVLYIVAGVLIVGSVAMGLREREQRWRIAGLMLLTTGLVMQGIAAAGYARDLRTLVYFIYAVAAALRALACYRSVS